MPFLCLIHFSDRILESVFESYNWCFFTVAHRNTPPACITSRFLNKIKPESRVDFPLKPLVSVCFKHCKRIKPNVHSKIKWKINNNELVDLSSP